MINNILLTGLYPLTTIYSLTFASQVGIEKKGATKRQNGKLRETVHFPFYELLVNLKCTQINMDEFLI